jgi:hypothetical protein
MNTQMTPQQALMNLYTASRLAKLSEDEHKACDESAKILQETISPKETESTPENKSEKAAKVGK